MSDFLPILLKADLSQRSVIEKFFLECTSALSVGRSVLHVDLSDSAFITPEGWLSLVTAGRLWRQHHNNPVELSFNSKTASYAQQINLFAACHQFLVPTHSSQSMLKTSTDSTRLLQITGITSDDDQNPEDVHRVLQRAWEILIEWFEPERANPVRILLSEICTNIVHSHDYGYVMMQRYKQRGLSRIHIAIADLGIGIRQSLLTRRDTPSFPQEAEYLLYALKSGITARAGIGGQGLTTVSNIVGARQGELVIRSGHARIEITSEAPRLRSDLTFIPGTQVFIQVNDV